MITPKTHPHFYRTLEILDKAWQVPLWVWNSLSDDIRDAVRETYKLAKPDELDSGIIDEVKFLAWYASQEKQDKDFYNRAVVKTICQPMNGAPPLEGEWYDMLTAMEVNQIVNFTRPSSLGNGSGRTGATANEPKTEAEPASTPQA